MVFLKKKIKNQFNNKHIKEIISGSAIALLFKVLFAVLGYTVTLLITRRFGAIGLGIFNLSNTVLLLLAVFCALGFQTAILRFAGQVNLNLSQIIPIYKNILLFVIPFSIVISCGLFVFSDKIAVFIFKDTNLSLSFRIISLVIPAMVVKNINIELFRGLKKIRLSEFIRNLSVHLINIVLLLSCGLFIKSIYLPVLSYTISVFLTFCISFFYILKYFSGQTSPVEMEISKKEMLKISLPMLITAVSFQIMGKIDTVMLGIFKTTESVGIYAVAFKLASVTSYILFAITRIVAPKISELFWSKQISELESIIKFSAKIIFFTSAPILVILLIFPEFFLGIFGDEFIIGKGALIFLVLGQFVNSFCGTVGHFLTMTGNQKYYMKIVSGALILNVILNYVLIPPFGIVGAAIATMISKIFWNITSLIYIKVMYGVSTYYYPGFLNKKR